MDRSHPGTTWRHHLKENIGAATIDLTADDLYDIGKAAARITVQGAIPRGTGKAHLPLKVAHSRRCMMKDEKMIYIRGVAKRKCFTAAVDLFLSLPSSVVPGFAQTVPAQDLPKMVITRARSRPTQSGPSENFTGTVRVTPLFEAREPARVAGASVSFEAGARSAWHTHPLGQILIVTAGVGRVQQWGDPVEEIQQGDVVWTPPGVKHWHGAAPTTAMTHLALQEQDEGKLVGWMEKVSDAQYQVAVPNQSNTRSNKMLDKNEENSNESPSEARKAFGDIAPTLAMYTDEVLFGDVWKRPDLSPRDRSLITVAALVAGYRTNELPFHLRKALDNGVSKDELIELITHLAFYSGWPTANTALPIARKVFQTLPIPEKDERK